MTRRRPAGKVIVEQARDMAALDAIIGESGMDADRIARTGALVLVAWLDDESVGAAEMNSHVDAALLRAIWVRPAMRCRGIGAALLASGRKTARIRGARRLYAYGAASDQWLRRSGFAKVDQAVESGDGEWLREHEPAHQPALWMLDISGDGIIER